MVYESSAIVPNVTIQPITNIGTGDQYIQLKKPVKFKGRVGSKVFSPETIKEQSVSLALVKDYGVDFQLDDAEMALSVEEISKRYIEPASKTIAKNLDADLYKAMLAGAGSTTFGLLATQGLDKLFECGTALRERGSMGERKFIGTPKSVEAIMKAGRVIFNDQTELAKQYKEGEAGRISGFDLYDSYRLPIANIGTLADATMTITATEGTDILVITSTAGGTLKNAQPFTIAGVNELNEEGIDLGVLRVFRSQGDVTLGAGVPTNVQIQNKMYWTSTDSRQNLSATPVGSKAVDTLGTQGAQQGIAFTKEAFVLGCVELMIPKDTDESAVYNEQGMSIRFIRTFDAVNAIWNCRLDLKCGFVVARPEWLNGLILA